MEYTGVGETLSLLPFNLNNRTCSPYRSIKMLTDHPMTFDEKMLDKLYKGDLSVNQLMKSFNMDHDTIMFLINSRVKREHVEMYKKGNRTMFRLTKKGKELVEFWRSCSWYPDKDYFY